MLWIASAFALGLPEVLAGLDDRVPLLREASASVEQAEAELLAERGGFDPVLRADASQYGGKYVRSRVDTALEVKSTFGPSVEAGWGRGVGDIPAYAGDTETGPAGELYVGLKVPVLDGLGFGTSRSKLVATRAKAEGARAKLDDAHRKIALKATQSYWKWVGAARKLGVARAQLELAQRRAAVFSREVELGSRPALERIDNERVLQERRAMVLQAEAELQAAAQTLSLYLRAEDGSPRVPTADEAPTTWPAPAPLPTIDALPLRPDRVAAQATFDAERALQRGAANAVAPKLDVKAKGFQPLDTDRKAEVMVGATLEAPLVLRRGRGDLRAARARVARADAAIRWLDDSIRAEIAATYETRRLAEERVVAAQTAVEAATEVLALERRRFQLGGGDLLYLLLREDYLAKASKDLIEAWVDLHQADALLRAATWNREEDGA